MNNDYMANVRSRNEIERHNSMVNIESPRKNLVESLVMESPDAKSAKPQTEKRFRSVPKNRFDHITVRDMAVNGIRQLEQEANEDHGVKGLPPPTAALHKNSTLSYKIIKNKKYGGVLDVTLKQKGLIPAPSHYKLDHINPLVDPKRKNPLTSKSPRITEAGEIERTAKK